MIIGNRRLSTRDTFAVINPYSAEEVGRAANGTGEQIVAALSAARSARPQLNGEERATVLERAAEHYERRDEEAALLITQESGLCIKQARHEVMRALNTLRYAAHQARALDSEDFTKPYVGSGETGGARLEVIAEPVRLAVGITPFNHPLNLVVHKVAPAIAAGASIVVKPSEKTPLSALYFAEVLAKCGLPPHMVNVVTGIPAPDIVNCLVTYPGVEVVTFTGGTEAGRAIGQMLATSGRVVRYVAELGGNAAFVVMDDADIELAANIALNAFDNSGQRCTSIKRILLHEAVADDFIEQFLQNTARLKCGDPFDPSTDLGTVISEEAAKLIEKRVDRALADGAKLLLGHHRTGALYPPTVLDRVMPNMEVVRCETFGPVAPIIRVRSLEECIKLVRSGGYRLAGAIATVSAETAHRYASAIRVGQFSWNGPPGYRTENAPFGGFGDSGSGEKEGVVLATRAMMQLRTFYTHQLSNSP